MDIIKSFEILDRARSIRRYSRDYVVRDENVLEHTGWVALWSFLLAKDLEEVCGVAIDYEKLLTYAIIHDIDEVVTGDVPRMTKYYNPRISKAMKEVAESAVSDIAIEYGIPNLSDQWRSSKNFSQIEGVIVSIADMAAVVYMSWSELGNLGNENFKRVSDELIGNLNGLRFKLTPIHEGSKSTYEYLNDLVREMTYLVSNLGREK